MEELTEFIESNPKSKELKRAIAVQMVQQNMTYESIAKMLCVSTSFVGKWKQVFEKEGIAGLKLKYQGSQGYLDSAQKQEIIEWLQQQQYWDLQELMTEIEDRYQVVFASKQSYYEIFKAADISWKKTQKYNPKKDPNLVQKKDEITAWLATNQEKISSGELVVLFADECHLLWGDVCGYVWGKTNERIEVPIVNERERQTYYGALNLQTQVCMIQAYEKGNSDSTVAFMQYLVNMYPNSQIVLLWDGASYHRSQEVKDYLATINDGNSESDWKITCIRFAPNDPTQNPIEDVWLQAKRFIRQYYHLLKNFDNVKRLFELVTHLQVFCFEKIFKYGFFPQLI